MVAYTIFIAWFGCGFMGATLLRIYWKRVWGRVLPLMAGECVMLFMLGTLGLITALSFLFANREAFRKGYEW